MVVNRDDGSLKSTVQSILNQSFTDFEYIIINDGKDPDVINVVNDCNDDRIRLKNIEKVGLTRALNYGLNFAKGDYIARQDGGDISLENRFRAQVDFLQKNPDIALLGTSIRNESLEGDFLGNTVFPSKDQEIKSHIVFQNTFWHGTVIFKREIALRLKGYRDFFKMAQDYDLWLRISENYKVHNLKEILYVRTVDKNSISLMSKHIQMKYGEIARIFHKDRQNNKKEDLSQLEPVEKLLTNYSKPVNKVNADYFFYCGRLLLTERNKKVARSYFIQAVKNQPFHIVTIIFLFVTFIPNIILNRIEKIWKFFQKKANIQLQ